MNNKDNTTRTPRWILATALTVSGLALGHQAIGDAATSSALHSASVPAHSVLGHSVPGHSASPSATPDAALALGYRASTDEPRIQRAQARARKAQTPAAFAHLAATFLQRKRETSDAAYYQYAVGALETARQLDDNDLDVLMVRIMVEQDAHRFASARDLARTLIAARGDDPSGQLLLGDALLELGDYSATIKAYEAAADLRPDLRSYNRGAYLRWLHGDFEGALELIELAIDAGSPRDPESSAWCYVDLANMYLQRGDAKRAQRAAALAEQLVPGYVPALVVQARAHVLSNDAEAAIQLLEQSTKRLPHVADLLLLSEQYTAIGNTSAATQALTRAESLAHTDPRPLALYYARHNIQPQQAHKLALQELAARENVEAFDTLALAALRHGDLDAAAAAAEQALKLGTPNAAFHLHRGLVRAARGNHQGASDDLASATTLNAKADPLLTAELTRALARTAEQPQRNTEDH